MPYKNTNMEVDVPQVPRTGNVIHHVPGRLRIKILGGTDIPEYFLGLKELINAMPGVNSVRVNSPASSIVIDYIPDDMTFHARLQDDPNIKTWLTLDEEMVSPYIVKQEVALHTPYLVPHSRVAEAIVSVAERLDVGLRQASNGYLDLKVLLPIGIAIGTSLHKARGRGTPMWITLSTFAFNSFLTLHHQRIDAPIIQIFSRPARRG